MTCGGTLRIVLCSGYHGHPCQYKKPGEAIKREVQAMLATAGVACTAGACAESMAGEPTAAASAGGELLGLAC